MYMTYLFISFFVRLPAKWQDTVGAVEVSTLNFLRVGASATKVAPYLVAPYLDDGLSDVGRNFSCAIRNVPLQPAKSVDTYRALSLCSALQPNLTRPRGLPSVVV